MTVFALILRDSSSWRSLLSDRAPCAHGTHRPSTETIEQISAYRVHRGVAAPRRRHDGRGLGLRARLDDLTRPRGDGSVSRILAARPEQAPTARGWCGRCARVDTRAPPRHAAALGAGSEPPQWSVSAGCFIGGYGRPHPIASVAARPRVDTADAHRRLASKKRRTWSSRPSRTSIDLLVRHASRRASAFPSRSVYRAGKIREPLAREAPA